MGFWLDKASKEISQFNDLKAIEKVAFKFDNIWYYKSRLLEAEELRAVGHLAETINVEDFTGINFKVPLVDEHSPLAISIALHLHYVKYPHRGAETLYRVSLQFVHILRGRKIFEQIAKDCIYCKKLRKRCLDQVMGNLGSSQISISPIFYFTMVD